MFTFFHLSNIEELSSGIELETNTEKIWIEVLQGG